MGIADWLYFIRPARARRGVLGRTSLRKKSLYAARNFQRHFDPLESRTMLSVTALSFVDANGQAVTSMYAGQTVYLRADASDMVGKTIQVSVWEDDGASGDDKLVSKSIKIGKDGYGTVAWATGQSTWQYKDEASPYNYLYLYYDAPAGGEDVYSGSAGTGHLKIAPGGVIKRVDSSAAIRSDLTTFVIVHGMNGNAGLSWISSMAAAIKSAGARAGETYQVLTLDWSYCAKTSINGTTLKYAKLIGQFGADILEGYGITKANLNLIGHSWGAYVADEVAESFGGVNTIVALDPGQVIPVGYSESEVNFAAHSNWSWAFHASNIYGSQSTPGTADRAFLIQAADNWMGGAHNAVPVLFTRFIARTTGGVSQYFSLSKLLSAAQNKSSADPWSLNKYGQGSYYEAVIATVGNAGDNPASISFTDNSSAARMVAETPPTISVSAPNATAGERLTGTDNGVIRISRSGGTSSAAVTVYFSASGTATSGTDYSSIGTSAVIPSGKTYVDIIVKAIDDSLAEASETVIVTLAANAAYKLSTKATSAKVTIADNEPVVKLAVSDGSAKESEDGKQTATFTISRSGGDLSRPLTVTYTIAGTAANGTDYELLSGTITIAAGSKTAAILIKPIDDTESESTETVLLTLVASTAYNIAPVTQKALIYDWEPVRK